MRSCVVLISALFLSVMLSGCSSDTVADSDLPPGVRKNEHPNTGVAASKKGKPFLVDAKQGQP